MVGHLTDDPCGLREHQFLTFALGFSGNIFVVCRIVFLLHFCAISSIINRLGLIHERGDVNVIYTVGHFSLVLHLPEFNGIGLDIQ